MNEEKDITRKVDNKIKWLGEYNPKTETIKVNKKKNKEAHRKGELIDTIVHEELHAAHPRLGEKDIVHLTKTVVNNMSEKLKANLYNKYADSNTKR